MSGSGCTTATGVTTNSNMPGRGGVLNVSSQEHPLNAIQCTSIYKC